ncbi:hypothetical protein AABB24_008381 [Solanum stoloniferum]|uniref:DUF1985 domain-containing protein n=1 Tax=Solanum stoloniferum TaxID=62892 RepID=A0ABD2UTP5_9SOLN
MREERRSEHLQDPIGMQNLPQIQNGNVESSSTRGDLEKDNEERIVVKEDGNEEYLGGNEFIRKSDLMSRFTKKVWADNEDDALKFAILYFIHTYVYSGERTSKRIHRIHFDLIESGRYR